MNNISHHLGHNIRDRGRAHDDAVLVLEKNPSVNPSLQMEQWIARLVQNTEIKTKDHFLNHSWMTSLYYGSEQRWYGSTSTVRGLKAIYF